MTISESISLDSPGLFLLILPLLALLGAYLGRSRERGALPFAGLEYLLEKKSDSGKKRKLVRTLMLSILVLGLGLLWTNPVTHTSRPIFGGGEQVSGKQFVVVFDMSPSMNLTMGNAMGEKIRGLTVNDQGITKYEVARDALFGFIDRFKGNAFGLIIFSTEPLLARWPTVETDKRFNEILNESLRRGSGSQLESYSGLTNTDDALFLARDVIQKSRVVSVEGSIVILIADAWDDVEAMELAIKQLRDDDIHLYIIGTGIPEDITEKLTEDFADDPGFRIFHVDSQAEMAQAYYLVGDIEESPGYAIDEKFETNIRWLVSLILVIVGTGIIWALEVPFHRSHSADTSTGSRGRGGRGLSIP
jgi:hypothetical protein